MKNYFIIHGSFGTSQEHWLPWLEEKLKKDTDTQVFNLDFPIGIGRQSFEHWEYVLDSIKKYINENSIFVCRSISCIFLVKYCIKNNIKIGKVVFISGFNNMLGLNEDYDSVNCTMYTNRCEEFKYLCNERICFYSKNDPYVPLKKLEEFIDLIDAKAVLRENAGHFNTDSGYSTFEDLLEWL